MRTRFAAAALLAALSLATPVFAETTPLQRTISLSGHGEVRAAPDRATLMIGVNSQAANARDAVTANSKAMVSVMEALQKAGIAEKDIQTSNFSVQPRYNYNNNNGQPPELVGYDVTNTVNVTIRKIEMLGSVLDQTVSAGSNQVNGISFDLSDPQKATDEARKLAVQDASRKAKLFADAAGVKLGSILSVSEGAGFQPPMPFQPKAMRAEAAGAPPIAAGEQVVGADVTIVWSIE